MAAKHIHLKKLLTDAVVDLCRKESFYYEELRIEGTLCLVSDKSSVLIAQITEQIGEHFPTENTPLLPVLDKSQAEELGNSQTDGNQPNGFSVESISNKRKNEGDNFETGDQIPPKRGKITLPTERSTGGKYKCPFCPKAYQFKHSLKDHINKHMGWKPHICKHCSMTFSHLGSLCAHVRRQHYQQITSDFICSVCDEKFMNEQSLKHHFNRRHQNEANSLDCHPIKKKQQVEQDKNYEDPQEGDTQTEEIQIKKEPETPDDSQNAQSFEQSEKVSDRTGADTEASNGNQDEDTKDNDSQDKQDGNLQSGMAQVMQSFMQMFENPNSDQAALAQMQAQQAQFLAAAQGFQGMQNMGWTPQAQMAAASMMHPFAPFMQPPDSSKGNSNNTSSPSPMTSSASRQTAPSMTTPTSQLPPNLDLQRTPDGKFQCPYCEKMYNFKHTLKDHINKHMGKRPHVCKHCGDSFTHLASLCAHIKRRHDNEMPADYQCEICNEKFMNLQSLKQHFTWRHKDVKFSPQKILERSLKSNPPTSVPSSTVASSVTEPSTNAFSSAAAMPNENSQSIFPEARFFAIDDKKGDFNSDIVDPPPDLSLANTGLELPPLPTTTINTEMDEDSLSMLTSEEDSDIKPSQYIAEYFSEVNLQTDHGLYKYKCKLCGNMFKIRNSLYEHLNSHLGKKPHICQYCGDAFTHHSSLHNHVRNKHSPQSREEREAQYKHQCSSCDKKFRFPSELDRHYRSNPDHGTATNMEFDME